MLVSFLCGEFLLHIPYWLYFYLGSLSFFFLWGVSLTHPMLASLSLSLSLIWGVSLRHPMLALFLSGESLLHIPRCLHFYAGSFSYTSRAGFFNFYQGSFSYISRAGFFLYLFIWGVSLAHPALVFFFFFFFFFLLAQFLLHISCWLHFCLGSFSYTSRAGLIFLW